MRLAMTGAESALNPTNTDPGQFDVVGGTNPYVENSGDGLADTNHNFGGCFAIKCGYTADAWQYFIDSTGAQVTRDEFYFRGYFRLASTGDFSFGGIYLFSANTDVQTADALALVVDTNDKLVAKRGGWTGTTLATSSSSVVGTQWVRCDIYIKVANSGGRFRVKIDGVTEIDFTGDTLGTATAFDRVCLWGFNAVSVWHDDFGLNDLNGGINDGELGANYIIPLLPANSDFSEQPPDDATYEEIAAGVRVSDGVVLGATTLATNSPVCLWVRCKGVGSAGTVQPFLKIGGTNYDSPSQSAPATDWKYVRYIWDENPDTGSAWTVTEVNALEFGLKCASGTVRVSGMLLEVEGTGGSSCDDEALESAEISEYTDTDLVVPGPFGAPDAQEHAVQSHWQFEWAEEDPGGFMEGKASFPWGISDASPINYLDDIYYNPHDLESDLESEEVYRGRVERIDRRSDAGGQWIDFSLFGWIRNAQGDRLYWGKLQQRSLDDMVAYAGVGPGGYVDTIEMGEVQAFADGTPFRTFIAPAGTGLAQPAGGSFQFDVRTDPYAPNPRIQRVGFRWNVTKIIPGARFQIIAYAPVGAYSSPQVIYDVAHTAGTKIVSLFEVGVIGGGPDDQSVLPVGTWRLIIRPYAFTQAVNTVPEPGCVLTMWLYRYAQLPTGNPIAASTIFERIRDDSTPALDSDGVTATTPTIDGYVVETPTAQTSIWDDLLLYAPVGFTYWVREKLANNRYRTYFGPQPTDVRYEVTNVEVTGMGGDVENVCNKAVITFTDYLGRSQTHVKEQSVTFLDDVSEDLGEPFLRERHLNVGKLKGSTYQENLQNAVRIADVLLEESRTPQETGSFRVIGKQVYDNDEAAYVDFRYIKPGEQIRVTDTGTGDTAVWRIRRVEKALDTRMECIITVGKGTTRLDAVILKAQDPNG